MEKFLDINRTISILGAKNFPGGLERSPETCFKLFSSLPLYGIV
jgi:hypothetical protein